MRWLWAFAVLAVVCAGEPVTFPIVQTDCGPVQGVLADGNPHVHGFYGIPYSLPPTGDRRWKAPVGLAESGQCWSGTLNASAYGSPCMQFLFHSNSSTPSPSRNQLGPLGLSSEQLAAAQTSPHSAHVFQSLRERSSSFKYVPFGSEDCLTLNVFTPAVSRHSAKPLPVLFAIHGGSSIAGWSGQYNHTALIEANPNVIVVSTNYRLNAFGFLALEALSKNSATGVSGNYGLLDVIQALRWVQNNIAAFGGDPNRVTIYGQSSGGTIVLSLVVSPLAKGLFHRGISMSASAMIDQDLKSTERFNLALVDSADCTLAQNVTACLYSLSALQVLESAPFDVFPFWNDASSYYSLLDLPTSGVFGGGLEIVDGYVIPLPIEEALAGGAKTANDVDLIIGYMAQEPDFRPPQDLYSIESEQGYEAWMRNSSLKAWGDATINHVLSLYPYSDYENAQHAYESIVADMRVGCGNLRLARIAANSFQSNVFFYQNVMRLNHPDAFIPPWTQRYSFHMFDLIAFLDQYLHYDSSYPILPQDRDQTALLQTNFLQFAHTGSPQSDWAPLLSTGSTSVAILNSSLSVVSNWKAAQCGFWEASGFVDLYSWNN